MNKSKIEIQRPLSHHLIIIGYLLAPVLYYVIVILPITFLSTGNRFIPSPFIHYFDKFGYVGGILILLYPFVALFLYYISRISWYVFLLHSCLVIADNIYRFPKYLNSQYRITITLLIVTFTASILFIIQKDFRSPYLHIIKRSFRRAKRIAIDHLIILNAKSYELTDLSTTGCFVSGQRLDLILGQKVQVKFESDRLTFECDGVVSRYGEADGAGIHFTSIDQKVKNEIKDYLVDRYSERFYVDYPAQWTDAAGTKSGAIKNISLNGCYVEIDTAAFTEGTKGLLQATALSNEHFLYGKIIWIKPHTKGGSGMAIKFKHKEKALLNRIKASQA